MSEEAEELLGSLEALMTELHRNLAEEEMFRGTLLDEDDLELCSGEVMLYRDAPGGLFEPTSAFLASDTASRAAKIKCCDPLAEPIPIFGVMKCPASGTLHFHFMADPDAEERLRECIYS